MAEDSILVLNAGSSSVKFELFGIEAGAPVARLSGQMEGIGATPRLTARNAAGERLLDRRFDEASAVHHKGHRGAINEIFGWIVGETRGSRIAAVGHRVVHGGPDLAAPLLVDEAVLTTLRAISPLAPLHQPHNIAGIEAAMEAFPGVPQVACFDTAFHRAHPWVADTFALPPAFYERGIRRYGFHGLSYEYIARSLAAEDAALARGRIVVAHLGNGASLCAIRDGRSIDSTMGFTALDGVPMGSRSGQIDPGVILHLLDAEGMTTAEVTALLYGNAGLKGMSGVSQDVRDLEASDRPEAARALEHFAYRVRREIGGLAAVLGGLDALVFTAGIGENARNLRARICEGLGFLGILVDAERNAANAREISPPGAPVRVLVRPTDEEAMIARHTLELLARRAAAAA